MLSAATMFFTSFSFQPPEPKDATKKLELVKTREHSTVDRTIGTYLPFRKVWEMEGLDKPGFQACLWELLLPNTHAL